MITTCVDERPAFVLETTAGAVTFNATLVIIIGAIAYIWCAQPMTEAKKLGFK